jgi:hypothetical protein
MFWIHSKEKLEFISIDYGIDDLIKTPGTESYGFYVRCIKN